MAVSQGRQAILSEPDRVPQHRIGFAAFRGISPNDNARSAIARNDVVADLGPLCAVVDHQAMARVAEIATAVGGSADIVAGD